ncbi:MAG: hydrogenase formation protein HypD [Candidatus Bathyarchaeota archaeon]|nr:hydrogenase formation protein HypD [Candidatus Bathyarchaeota archaeon]
MFSFVDAFRDDETARKVVKYIKELAGDRKIRIVHVCGTHEDTITKYGIRSMLPRNVEVLMGPGCPVCTVPPTKIDYAIRLAEEGAIVTSYGDMMMVPAGLGSLSDAKAKGHDIRIVYSIHDAVKMAQKTDKEVVHFGVGFETTAPTTASELAAGPPENFSVYSAHLTIPPAMMALLDMGVTEVHGFIDPGHVSTIIGEVGYSEISSKYKVPQVIAGFEPLDVLFSVAMILRQIKEGRGEVENGYKRAVKPEGAPRALALLDKVFEPEDAPWRGIGVIPKSGLKIRDEYEAHDAAKKFDIETETSYEMPHGCRCGDVLRAICYPWECPLFNKECSPESPVGPCMVSHEGSCFISARYGVEEIL